MKPRQLSVLIARFPYGGNGATSAEIPEICDWVTGVVCKAKKDPRISDISSIRISDTPITMTRNQAIHHAQQAGIDIILMLDSDNAPDIYVGNDPLAKPFFESSFDFLYENWDRGPHVVGTPYCGPPPHATKGGIENVYVFRWAHRETGTPNPFVSIVAYSREEAAAMSGIQPCAALPTGVIMYDMRCFDLIDRPYFDYEWEGDGGRCQVCNQPKPGPRMKKCSTEDVYNTRNISLGGQLELGYNPVFCNWDAWAGHWKPKCVGKPYIITTDFVTDTLKRSVLEGRHADDRLVLVGDAHRNDIPKSASGDWMGHEVPFCDRDALVETIHDLRSELGRKPIVVEVGTFAGLTAIEMADAGAIVHCVDHWQGNPNDGLGVAPVNAYETFLSNIGDRRNKTIFVHRGASLDVAANWHSAIDMVFIDASHEYEDVKADIAAWSPFVRPGGVVCGHDYLPQFPGVIRAANEYGIDGTQHSLWHKTIPAEVAATNGRIPQHADS